MCEFVSIIHPFRLFVYMIPIWFFQSFLPSSSSIYLVNPSVRYNDMDHSNVYPLHIYIYIITLRIAFAFQRRIVIAGATICSGSSSNSSSRRLLLVAIIVILTWIIFSKQWAIAD